MELENFKVWPHVLLLPFGKSHCFIDIMQSGIVAKRKRLLSWTDLPHPSAFDQRNRPSISLPADHNVV